MDNTTVNNIPEIPKVVSTRACSTYDPNQFMSEFIYDNGRRELYLEVKYRVDWFNHWCMEHHVKGTILDQCYEIIPEMRMILATSVIMMDDKEVARAIAGRAIPEDPTGMNVIVQSAFTCAKGRALANLGFGTTNGSTNENGEDIPPDSGIPLPKVETAPETKPQPQGNTTASVMPQVTAETNPMMIGDTGTAPAVVASGNNEEPPKSRRGRKPKNSEETPVAPSVANEVPANQPQNEAPVAPAPKPVTTGAPRMTAAVPTTIEEARAFVCPIGTGKDKTMGELYLTDRGKVEFFAGPRFASADRHPALVAAAKLLLAQG